jgi:hypothetical protein
MLLIRLEFRGFSFAQRQRHMRNRCTDKHHDSTEYSGEKNSHVDQE